MVAEALRAKREQVPPDVSLEFTHADDLAPLFVDRTRIQQVIENLIGNA